MSQCLVMIVHGSKDPRWREPFERLAADIAGVAGAGRTALAYMEFAAPTLMDVAVEQHARGVRELTVLPVFLAAGAHVATDIPAQIDAVRAALSQMTVDALPPLGEHPRVQALLRELIVEIVAAHTPAV